MKRVVAWTIWTLLAIAAVVIGGAYALPDEAVVQRQATIQAPPEVIFPLINDLRRMQEWSPWADLDPRATYTYEGANSGVGQKMSWASLDPNVGSGSMTITESVENRRVVSTLDFGDGGTARASMELSQVEGGTGVTWGFKAPLRNPLERWMGLLFDRWIGADYEKGLARLAQVAQRETK